jgi:hypothetical protein
LLLAVGLSGPAFAEIRYFPNEPDLLFPQNNTTLQIISLDTPFTFRWDTVEGADGYIFSCRGINNSILIYQEINETSVTVVMPFQEDKMPATLQWGVIPTKTGIAPKPLFNSNRFTVALIEGIPTTTPFPIVTPTPTPALDAPVLLAPKNGDNFPILTPINFSWTKVTGAAEYTLSIYKNNELLTQQPHIQSTQTIEFNLQTSVRTVYQWIVQAFTTEGEPGQIPPRAHFSIGHDTLPTPTPRSLTADMDNNQIVNSLDLFMYALRYKTNDPLVDFNNNGINENNDLLLYLLSYKATK